MSVLKNFLGPLWLLYVFSWYIHYHDYYWTGLSFWGTGFLLFLIWSTPLLLIWGIQKWRQKNTLTITPIRVILATLILIWITGVGLYAAMDPGVMEEPYQFIQYDDTNFAVMEEGEKLVDGVDAAIKRGTVLLNWNDAKIIFPEPIQSLFVNKSVASFAGNLAKNLGIIVGSWLFLLVLFHNLGALILRRQRFTTIHFFQSVAMGMGGVMLTLFGLGIMGLLSTTMAWIAIGLLLGIGIIKLPFLIKGLKAAEYRMDLKTLKWWVVPLFMVIGISLSFTLLNVMKPFPVGYDSMMLYHNTPNLIAYYGTLISGIVAYNFELIISLGQLLWHSTMIGTSISLFGAFLGIGLFFELLRKYFSWEKALLLVAIFISLPMNRFMMNIDLKIDLPLLLFTLLAIYSLVQWKQNKDKKELILAGIWFGIGMGIKYTTALLIATACAWLVALSWGSLGALAVGMMSLGVFGFLSFDFYLDSFTSSTQQIINIGWIGLGGLLALAVFIKKGWPQKSWRPLITVGLVSMAILSPWLIYNGVQAHSINPNDLLYGQKSEVAFTRGAFGIDPSTCETASTYSELELYTGSYNTHSLGLLPIILWESTINSTIPNNRLTDIGFLFLGFGIFVLFGLKEANKEDKNFKKIVGYSLLYGILWLFTSRGIVWYGMPLFLGLFIIYERTWRTEKWPYAVIGLWLFMSVMLGIYEIRTDVEPLLYAGGVTDESIYLEQTQEGVEAMGEILNSDEALDKNVYLIGRFVSYFITENDQRVYNDLLLDDFRCYFLSDDPNITLSRLREANFGYVIYMEDALEAEEEGSVLHGEFEKVKAFMEDYLIEEVYTPDMVLYSVPS